MTKHVDPVVQTISEIPLTSAIEQVDPDERTNSETSKIDEEALGLHEAQSEDAQTGPYEDLADLEGAFILFSTMQSLRDTSMIGPSGSKPT